MYGKDMAETAFAARCLLRQARVATLATTDDGQPFASLITPVVTGDGGVLMLLSSLAAHSRHLARAPRCAVMVVGTAENLNPQTAPRLTITGVAAPQEDQSLRRFWLRHHPYAALYADFTDFSIWRVQPQAGLFVGGFARADRLSAVDLSVSPEIALPLAAEEAEIVARGNTEYANAVDELAHAHGGAGHWHMLGVDADGFDLIQDESVLRVAFDAPVEDVAGVKAALTRMLARARAHW